MHFSLETRTVTLSVGDFAGFSLGPQESGGGPQGLWRAQLGQHWHNELQKRTEQEFSVGGALRPDVRFEVPIEGRLIHRGWTFTLQGRIDQLLPDCRAGSPALSPPNGPDPASGAVPSDLSAIGSATAEALAKEGVVLREIKSVMRPLPVDEPTLRADYPAYFLQLSAYVLLAKVAPPNSQLTTDNRSALRAELVFVEASSGVVQTIALTPFDEALVFHQLDALVEFLNQQLRATARRRALQFQPPFTALRAGQETIQSDLAAVFTPQVSGFRSQVSAPVLLLEAPTGYGKTGCVLEFALGQLKAGRFARLIWLTGKSTGQIHVMHTLRQMTSPGICHIMDDKLPPPSSGTDSLSPADESPTHPETCHPLYDKSPAGVSPLSVWQIRNKSEHCVNHTFHCVRDGCDYLRDCAERWPGSGLSRFYLDEHEPRDLDTLKAAGRVAQICPYEITRAALPFCDVWIGDFNYVFAPDNRGLFFDQPGFDPAETLLVVDEAHNLPSRVAGAYSHRATESDAHLLLAELDHLQAPAQLVLAVEEWTRLLASLTPTESLDSITEAEIRDLLERLVKLTTTHPLDYAALGPIHSETLWRFSALLDWLDNAQTNRTTQSKIENHAPQNRDEWRASSADASRAASTPQREKSKIKGLLWVARSGQLEFTCVDAAAAIGETLKPFGGAILMSATLQPYAEFAESCGLNTPRPAGHPSPEGTQTLVTNNSPLSRGVARSDGVCFLTAPTPWRAGAYDVAVDLRVSTTYRDRATHHATTAATIASLHEAASLQVSGLRAAAQAARLVPGSQQGATGSSLSSRSPISEPQSPNTATSCVAVFFPSYAYAEAIEKTLFDYGSVLRVALQPKLPDLAAQTAWVEENLALSDALFLVLGSSFAEGIDLLGGRVTHAMVVGPALPEVNAVQKARLSALSEFGRDAAFRRVYQIPGLQKVNQGLGRLVRAPGQKAKVLLHCRRFAEPSYASLLAADYQFFSEIYSESDLNGWLAR